MPERAKRRNRTETAYETLKKRILEQQIQPGAMLGEIAIAKELEMSRTPVREALKMLKSEDLLEIRDGVGTFVKSISRQDIKDAYEVRKALELLAIQTAILCITDEEIEMLRQNFLVIQGKLMDGTWVSVEEYAHADWALHDLIIQRCENKYVHKITGDMGAVLRRYQCMSVGELAQAGQSLQEHLMILDGIQARNVEQTTQLLSQHIQY